MPAYLDNKAAGLRRRLTIDGIDISIFPKLTVDPQPIQTAVATADEGSQTFQAFLGIGHADFLDRYAFSLPFGEIYDTSLRDINRIRVRGALHTFAYWKPVPAFFTARLGQTKFYLPRYRKNAAQVHAGLVYDGVPVSTTAFPFLCWINGAVQTVTYAAGPTLAVPAAGSIVVSMNAETTGANIDYVPFLVGNSLADGDTVEIEFFPLFSVKMENANIAFNEAQAESHTLRFTER